MCNWCNAILQREKRYTTKLLDLSINLYFRLLLEEHFNLNQLGWLRTTIPDNQYLFQLSRLLPPEFVNSNVWTALQFQYPSIIREAIRVAYDTKKKRQKISMELIYLGARTSKYLIGCQPSPTPNKLNQYRENENKHDTSYNVPFLDTNGDSQGFRDQAVKNPKWSSKFM